MKVNEPTTLHENLPLLEVADGVLALDLLVVDPEQLASFEEQLRWAGLALSAKLAVKHLAQPHK